MHQLDIEDAGPERYEVASRLEVILDVIRVYSAACHERDVAEGAAQGLDVFGPADAVYGENLDGGSTEVECLLHFGRRERTWNDGDARRARETDDFVSGVGRDDEFCSCGKRLLEVAPVPDGARSDGDAVGLCACLQLCDDVRGAFRVHCHFDGLEPAVCGCLCTCLFGTLGNVAENAHDRHRF